MFTAVLYYDPGFASEGMARVV